MRLVVKNSSIEGRGVFASRNIKKGEIICTIIGEKLDIVELKKRYDVLDKQLNNLLQISDSEYIYPYEPYIFFNHSCSPNTGVTGLGTIFATSDISGGEELTFDYSTVTWDNDRSWQFNWTDYWKISCRCGALGCRKEIRLFPLIPNNLKRKYYRAGALMDFILTKASDLGLDLKS